MQRERIERPEIHVLTQSNFSRGFKTLIYELRDRKIVFKNWGRWAELPSGKISIVIPTLSQGEQANHLSMLRKLLSQHLPNQTYKNYEALVYCDGPNKEVEILVNQLKDPRIKLFSTENRLGLWGHPQTRLAIAASTGDFFVRINDDNSPYRHYLETLMSGFTDPNIMIVYGRVIFDKEAREKYKGGLQSSYVLPQDISGTLRLGNVDCMNYMVRMSAAKAYTDLWSDGFEADWIFLENLLKKGMKAKFVDRIIGVKN